MNKIIDQSESDFRKSISKMSSEEQESLLRLINRELALTQQELKRSNELLALSKEKQNNLEMYRYEQNIRDIELEVEKLDRKRNICQSHTPKPGNKVTSNGNMTKCPDLQSRLSNGSAAFVPTQSRSSPTPQDIDDPDFALSTKKLINNFERLSSVTSPTSLSSSLSQTHSKVTSATSLKTKPPLSSSVTLPSYSKTKSQPQPASVNLTSDTTEPLFAQIKLKKIGLPPDAKEIDQSTLPNVVPPRRTSNDKVIQSTPVILSNNRSRISIVEQSQSNEVISKDKFHNPNKEIQVAIQNEIKDLKLKKTNPNSPPLNCAVEHVNMGKFNFSNERSMSSASLVSTQMSASKSMPFLNSIASMSIAVDDGYNSPRTSMQINEPSIDTTDCEFTNQDSFLKNWDPKAVLTKLYTIQKKSDTLPCNSSSAVQFASTIDVIHGSTIGRSWQREYIVIKCGQLNFYKNQASKSATDILDLRHVNVKLSHNDSVEIYDSRGIHSTIRCLRPSECQQLLSSLQSDSSNRSGEIVPHIYDDIKECHSQKILIIDLGSCSVRAGVLKVVPTLPGLYFPHVAAISKTTKDCVKIGFEALEPDIIESCELIRPLKPDTTLEHVAFTSGSVESTIQEVCSLLGINARDYIVMLSLPYNVAESTRSKLADVLLLRLNFRGVSMCGESLLALHAYGEPTGVLVDIGCRTEILPVTDGVVQMSAVKRSLFGGHLMQVALSHLLPYELHSIVDSLLIRLVMEEACCVAPNANEAHNYNKNAVIDLGQYNLPANIQSSLTLSGKDRCLATEGLFNPEIYSIDTCGLSKIIMQAIQNCPMDFRKVLYQSIYLSGATTQISGLVERLEQELRKIVPTNCDVKVYAAPDRAHFSYVGACFVASSDSFLSTVVDRRQWEDSRVSSLRKWHF